jgi:PAS domain S-box-containing protein
VVHCLSRDIVISTFRKLAGGFGRAQPGLLEIALENVRESLFLIDEHARFQFVNSEACRVLGYSREELLRLELFEVDPGFPRERWQAHWNALKVGPAFRQESWHRASDGRMIPVEIHASHFVFDGRDYHLALVRDLTERNRAQSALGQAQNLNTSIINHIHEGIIVLGLDLRYQDWNPYMEKLTGLTKAEVVGKHVFELFPGLREVGLLERVRRVLAGDQLGELEMQFPTPGGTENLWVIEAMAVLPDAAGVPQGVIVTVRDITERKRSELVISQIHAELHHAQKMESLGNLVGGVVHDFNNMLGNIMGASEILQLRNCEFDAEKRESYLQMILTSAKRAADLTSKLLAFSRKGKKNEALLDLMGIIEETAGILRRTVDRRIDVSVEPLAKVTTVLGDGSMLQNVFMNIGINGSHAMPDGGALVFTVRNRVLDPDTCANSPYPLTPGDYLEVEIRDTGTGMTQDVLERIFEPFFTTKAVGKGTGLGLSVAYGTILEHGGAIHVSSQVGVGSAFQVWLPVANGLEAASPVEAPPAHGRATILVVEDEDVLLSTTRLLLEFMGYQVVTATNGWEGVELFRTFHEGIDLVLLDMIMPVMGGRQAFDLMRAHDPKVPVILFSGFVKEEDLLEMKAAGLRGFLRKPVRQKELADAIGGALALSGC